VKFTARQYAIALHQSLEKCSASEQKQNIINFLKILHRNRQFNIIDKVIKELDKLIKEKNDILEIDVVSAVKIEEKELVKLLEKKLKKKIELKSNIDKEIIAGLIIKINDLLIDGSVKTQLRLLNNKLSNN
jgi:F-type H+-transporting ATPase subunit delta